MEEYAEGQLRESLSLYDKDPMTGLSVQDALEDAEYYLSGESDSHPLLGVSSLEAVVRAFRSHFAFWVMQNGEIRPTALDLSQRMSFLVQATELHRFEATPKRSPEPLSDLGETLLQLMATSRNDLLGPTEKIALAVVRSGRYAPPEGTTGYFIQPSKIGVFALEALAATRGETIDWESFHVPPDRFWLDAARVGVTEPNPAKAAQWAHDLCDAHLRTLATDIENGSMTPATGHEIREEAHFLWPITVIAFLRLRQGLGLPTDPFDHPLMQTSFRVLHDWTVPAGAWPGAPWWTEVLDKTLAVAPDLADAVALVR